MRISPADDNLRNTARTLAKNYGDASEKVMFLGQNYEVIEEVTELDIMAGGHRTIRDRLVQHNEVRAILHLVLFRSAEGRPIMTLSVFGAPSEQLYAMVCTETNAHWVPVTERTRQNWRHRWSD